MALLKSTEIYGSLNVSNYIQTANQLMTTIATGTAPLVVSSTTLVSNLNADLLDGVHLSSLARTDSAAIFTTIPAFNGGETGTSAPFIVDSTYLVSNLNAQYLNGALKETTLSSSSDVNIPTSKAVATYADGRYLQLTGGTLTGILNGTSITTTGDINSNNGRLVLRDNSIEEKLTNGLSGIAINYFGYNGGNTQFRNLDIYNGKEELILNVTGSTKITYFVDKVGIGYATPDVPLVVKSTTSQIKLLGDNVGSSQEAVFSFNSSSSNTLDIRTNYVHAANKITISPGAATAMTLLGSGYVGIGTAAPASLFEIKSASPVLTINGTSSDFLRGINFQNNGTMFASLLHNSSTGETTLTSGKSGDTAYFLSFDTCGVERMRIDDAGSVGIGTSSPAYILDVAGNTRIDGSLITTGNLYLNYDKTEASSVIYFGDPGDIDEHYLFFDPTTGVQEFKITDDLNVLNGNISAQQHEYTDSSNIIQAYTKYDSTSKSIKFVFA